MGVGSNPTPDSVSFAISEIEITARFAYVLYLRRVESEKLSSMPITVMMAEWSKAPDSRLRNLLYRN